MWLHVSCISRGNVWRLRCNKKDKVEIGYNVAVGASWRKWKARNNFNIE